MSSKYQQICLCDLKDNFIIISRRDIFELKYTKQDNPIYIKIPFELNESVATIAGMFPDGSLIKDLKRMYFTQKKHDAKILLFGRLLEELFLPESTIFYRDGHNAKEVYINSQTLARFFYHMLKITKSDEEMRVPKWIFNSPKLVITNYLREAFDAEAYVSKSLSEIRFITKDHNFALDLQKLLLKVGITSRVKQRIGGIKQQIQYRLSIYGRDNFIKFKDIGFSIPLHKERLKRILEKIE